MDVFVHMRGERALGMLMRAYYRRVEAVKNKKRPGQADNRTGYLSEQVRDRIEAIKAEAQDNAFSVNQLRENCSLTKGQASYLLNVMIKKNIARRLPRTSGEQGFRYKIDCD